MAVDVTKYRRLLSEYAAKIIAERPANLYTIERYLLLAGDLPGLRFRSRLVPSPIHPGAATLMVEVIEKSLDLLARSDNLGIRRAGLSNSWAAPPSRIRFASTTPSPPQLPARISPKSSNTSAGNYRQVLNSEGL